MPSAADRTLVTGFLAFEGFPINPSALLAESSGRRFHLLEVAYGAVDEFLGGLDPGDFERLLMLGVAGNSSRMRLEQVARNHMGARRDVRLVSPCPSGVAAIEPHGPDLLHGTLWNQCSALSNEALHRRRSDDAGTYLCNYIYYRALSRFGATHAVGFLHVPPLDAIDLPTQQRLLTEILQAVES
jgi:pyroglutamyl-peptidase